MPSAGSMHAHLLFFHKWFVLLLLLLLQQVVGQQDDNVDKKVAQQVVMGVTLLVLLCWMTWSSVQWSNQRKQQHQAFVAYEQELQAQIQRASSATMQDQDTNHRRPPPIPYQTYLVQALTTTTNNNDHDSRPIRTGEWRMQFVPLDNGCYRITGRGTDDEDGGATTIVHGMCGPTGSPAFWKEARLHRRVVARFAPLSGTAMLRLSPKYVLSKGSFDFASGTFSDGTWKNQVPSSPTEYAYDTPMEGIYGSQPQVTVRPVVLASDDDEENQQQYQPPSGLLMEQPVA